MKSDRIGDEVTYNNKTCYIVDVEHKKQACLTEVGDNDAVESRDMFRLKLVYGTQKAFWTAWMWGTYNKADKEAGE